MFGLWDKIKGEFIDVIEWTDDSRDTLVWRFERYNHEIKYGAKLTVRPSQVAVFVNEGQVADVFAPGMYTLETQNMPILSTLKGWKYGFQSPFKAEVYFVNTRRFTDLKWGTKNPVMLRDAEFGPIRLRAFGTYSMRVVDAKKLIAEVAGTDAHFTTDEISEQLRNLLVTRFSDLLAEARIPALDLAANYNEFGQLLETRVRDEFAVYGLEVLQLLTENISFPPEVEQALDKRTSMGILGDLNRYSQYQSAEAMRAAAENPGAAGAGMGMGLGMVMAQQVGQQTAQPSSAGQVAPPPLPAAVLYYVAVNGQQTGPFPVAELQAQVTAGRLQRDTLVWTQGMSSWQAAQTVAELANLFAQLPPPLPPVG